MSNSPEFDKIRNSGRLAYEYIRGSHLYGLDTPESDVDTGGVYLCTLNELYGAFGYMPQVSDEKHDNAWYEIGNLIELLMRSNPTALEAVFVPADKIISPIHPAMKLLLDNRDRFVTKQCFNSFFGYARSQISKARGLNKKIVNPVERRLGVMDFIYTFKGQGSQPLANWLTERGLKQRYCGLVNVPNMSDCHGVYYDFGQHCGNERDWRLDKKYLRFASEYFGMGMDLEKSVSKLESLRPIGYRGMLPEDKEANQLRLCSIPKSADRPICFISYNPGAYSRHCRMYREYQQWIKERNETRYQSNLNKNYDSKNMMHMFRLVHMGCEIAEVGA